MIKKLSIVPLVFFAISVVGQTKDETAVLKALEQLRTAMVSGDSSSLLRITAEKLSYGHSNGHIENKQEFVSAIASGASDYLSIELADQTVTISGDVAMVRLAMHAKVSDNGKAGELNLKVLLIWQKQNGSWLLLARQAVKASEPVNQ